MKLLIHYCDFLIAWVVTPDHTHKIGHRMSKCVSLTERISMTSSRTDDFGLSHSTGHGQNCTSNRLHSQLFASKFSLRNTKGRSTLDWCQGGAPLEQVNCSLKRAWSFNLCGNCWWKCRSWLCFFNKLELLTHRICGAGCPYNFSRSQISV